MKPAPLKTQTGAAILMAMLTVALVAALASGAMWQQWRSVEVETAQRARKQAVWVLMGALDWVRLILREDARRGGADHLGEPWAVPLEEAPLATFLAEGQSATQVPADEPPEGQGAFLSARIVDLQSRLNVSNLVQDGAIHKESLRTFTKLFKLLGLPQNELSTMAERLRLANIAAGAAPLWPQDIDQLSWFGLSPRTLQILQPFVCLLPERTPVNLNTAAAEVVYASVEAFTLADANRLVRRRGESHLVTLGDANVASANAKAELNETAQSVASSFFEVTSQLRTGATVVKTRFTVQRGQRGVQVVQPVRRMPAGASGVPLK